MNFFLITGPPAVGKMTVGQQLAQKTGYQLFHNHHSIELTLNIFDWGMSGFKKINEGIRQLVFQTVAGSKELKGFIFTLVWAFDLQEDWDYVANLKKLFTSQGWEFHIVELQAPLEVRLLRNNTPNRLEHKASKRNVEVSHNGIVGLENKYKMNSDPQSIVEDNYLRIDNSDKSAEEVADLIIDHFDLSES